MEHETTVEQRLIKAAQEAIDCLMNSENSSDREYGMKLFDALNDFRLTHDSN